MCVFYGGRSGREVVGALIYLLKTCLRVMARPWVLSLCGLLEDLEEASTNSGAPSIGFCRATGLLMSFRALGVNLTFERRPKHSQTVPRVPLPITELYCVVTTSPGPKLPFS